MKVPARYCIEFGKCDVTDWIPCETELTAGEAAIYETAVAAGTPLHEVPELKGALVRLSDEIEDREGAACEELGEDNPFAYGAILHVEFC